MNGKEKEGGDRQRDDDRRTKQGSLYMESRIGESEMERGGCSCCCRCHRLSVSS